MTSRMAKKQTSPSVSSIAARWMGGDRNVDEAEITSVMASALSQDESRGQDIKTETDVRAMFPEEAIEINALGHGRQSISATWGDEKNRMRQSIAIPPGKQGLSRAAVLLRDVIDAHKG